MQKINKYIMNVIKKEAICCLFRLRVRTHTHTHKRARLKQQENRKFCFFLEKLLLLLKNGDDAPTHFVVCIICFIFNSEEFFFLF